MTIANDPKSSHFVTKLSSTMPVPLLITMAPSRGDQPSFSMFFTNLFRKVAKNAVTRSAKSNMGSTNTRGVEYMSGRVRVTAMNVNRVSVSRSPRHEANGGEMLSERML